MSETEDKIIAFMVDETADSAFARKALTVETYQKVYGGHTFINTSIPLDAETVEKLQKHPMSIDTTTIRSIVNRLCPPFKMLDVNDADDFVREILICYRLYDTDVVHFSMPEHYLWRCSLAERQRLARAAGFPVEEALVIAKGENSFAGKITLPDIIKAMVESAKLPNSLPDTEGSQFFMKVQDKEKKRDWVEFLQWNVDL